MFLLDLIVNLNHRTRHKITKKRKSKPNILPMNKIHGSSMLSLMPIPEHFHFEHEESQPMPSFSFFHVILELMGYPKYCFLSKNDCKKFFFSCLESFYRYVFVYGQLPVFFEVFPSLIVFLLIFPFFYFPDENFISFFFNVIL